MTDGLLIKKTLEKVFIFINRFYLMEISLLLLLTNLVFIA
jgi:hypothetical protein